MSWARAALERNDRIEVVSADPQSRTFTVRVKDTGELRMVPADQVIAGPSLPATAAAAATTAGTAAPAASAPVTAEDRPVASAGEAAAPGDSNVQSAPPAAPAQAETPGGGRVLKEGPGYTIKAASTAAPAAGGRVRDSVVTSAAVERRHEPIVCQGSRLLHIDNRNLEFDGDAVSAQDGCEIHITNSHISATGVGVTARAANVHIDNSLIEGDTASIDASDGAQVYAASSRFRGLSRRLDTAAFHDLGGNIWN
ncbi:MAG TPA: hypothetical protein VOA80_04315 [Thermoanaerobaculia bacterium]|nr:hypothetical protein [Thermoanaerobaculia bacterium]